MKSLSTRLLGPFALIALINSGCVSSGYPQMLDYHSKIAALKGQGEGIPEARARFCLERANRLYQKAERNTGFDYMLLSLGGATAGGGVVSSAVAGAMDKDDANKTGFEIAGAALIASSAAFLSLRTALGLYDISRAERETAAKNVDAALAILTEYALAEDPGDVDYTKFTTCSDGEVAVASAFAGASAGQAIERLSAKKEKEAADEKKEVKEVREAAEKKLDQARESRIKAEEAKAQLSTQASQSQKGGPSVPQAPREAGAAEKDAALQILEAKVDLARADLRDAKADAETRKAAILRAAARLRAATFFLTASDVSLAKEALDMARNELGAAQKSVEAAFQSLAEAEKALREAQRTSKP